MSDPVTPLNGEQTETAEQNTAREGYVRRDLVGLDQFANVVTGGLPDETISSRMARWSTEGKGLTRFAGRAMSRFLDWFQRDHGAHAEAGDYERASAVEQAELAAGEIDVKGER